MIDFKEYSRQRDISVNRLKRMGIDAHVPTVKELRADTGTASDAFRQLREFLESGPSLSKKRESERNYYTPEQKAERRREYQRDYRRRKVAREQEHISGKTNKYSGYLKGIRKLGVDIKPSQLPSFFQYMDYRFAQGNASRKYVFDIFVDDFIELMQKGYKPDQIVSDYEKFQADQLALTDRAGSMSGISVTDAIMSWDKFVKE